MRTSVELLHHADFTTSSSLLMLRGNTATDTAALMLHPTL
jgi:hypothetical protein